MSHGKSGMTQVTKSMTCPFTGLAQDSQLGVPVVVVDQLLRIEGSGLLVLAARGRPAQGVVVVLKGFRRGRGAARREQGRRGDGGVRAILVVLVVLQS